MSCSDTTEGQRSAKGTWNQNHKQEDTKVETLHRVNVKNGMSTVHFLPSSSLPSFWHFLSCQHFHKHLSSSEIWVSSSKSPKHLEATVQFTYYSIKILWRLLKTGLWLMIQGADSASFSLSFSLKLLEDFSEMSILPVQNAVVERWTTDSNTADFPQMLATKHHWGYLVFVREIISNHKLRKYKCLTLEF